MPALSGRSVAKAHRLVDQGRVREVTATRTFVVSGDHGTYRVTVTPYGATCDCPAYVTHYSHVEAALPTMGGRRAERLASPAAGSYADQPPGPMAAGRLFTWYWRAALDAEPPGVTLVRISLGRPRWVHPARTAAIPYVSELAPEGRLFDLHGPEFDRAYRRRLNGFGVDHLERRFREVAGAHGGLPLVLLCFERDAADCHRGTFAAWWLERTAEPIPEYRLTAY